MAVPDVQMSQKGSSFHADSQALTPASVGSVDTSSQQAPSDGSSGHLETKAEVKQPPADEEEEADGGKLGTVVKMEEKPLVKLEVKKEECSGEGGKGIPMDTSAVAAAVKKEVKVEVKKEPKEEEESAAADGVQVASKKSELFCVAILSNVSLQATSQKNFLF